MASHLTLEEREVIAHMRRAGKMQTQIADHLGRSKSTISRELRRNRSRNGYWEGDTIVGANRRGGALTLVERKSGYLLLGKVPNLQAATVRKAAAQRYATTPAALRKTLTLDNGKEFAEHEELEVEAALRIYFAKPYCAWQRGTNENTNGLVRDFFPKGTDLAAIPEHRFTKVQQLLNDRPRKRLGYRTPNEVLASRLRPNGCD